MEKGVRVHCIYERALILVLVCVIRLHSDGVQTVDKHFVWVGFLSLCLCY